MAWGTTVVSDIKTFASAQTTWFTMQVSSTDIALALEPRELVHCQVIFDFPGTPTDDGEFQVLASPDDGTTWDTIPIMAFTADNGTDPNTVSFVISGYRYLRFQARLSGTTDTTTTCRLRYRKDGVAA